MSSQISFSKPYLFREEEEAATKTISSGWIVGGPRLKELEELFAQVVGTRYAVGVSSWTAGAFLVLQAWGIGEGDEVIVPSYSFIATANVVRHVGATPVFCDIDLQTHNLDVNHVARLITPRTRAIIPVDQLGMPCDIDAINDLATCHNLHVLQDAACAIGSQYKYRPVGKDTEVAIFSLHARKLVTCGEGGMILTNDRKLADKLRLLRHQGMDLNDFQRHHADKPVVESYPVIGYNTRLTDIQAAIAVVQMGRLSEMLRLRRQVAELYQKRLNDCFQLVLPQEPKNCLGNWQSYMVSLSSHAKITPLEVMTALHSQGIPTRRGVMAAHLEPCYQKTNIAIIPPLPNTEYAIAHNFQLPIHPTLSQLEINYICDALLLLL
ncbi:DegT/DnrJ/EryC1/StrS family aminotransferase [Geminocystis sp.]|uniref:DegT/DnrJ/EryC1/StrS family aminotransferase n=1 Tax=Geminocystis sp. TaxID=2664100 RepID=UPI003593FB04